MYRTAFCFFQARQLICNRLASLLSFRRMTDPSNVDGRNRKRDPKNHLLGDGDRVHARQHPAEGGASNIKAITDILSLLETRISTDDEDRQKSDKDAKIRREWMLAAAVIDRLCFIALIVIFTVGTLVFVVLFILS